jgi:hypothetical protein
MVFSGERSGLETWAVRPALFVLGVTSIYWFARCYFG